MNELGHLSLWLALAVAGLGVALPTLGAWREDIALELSARRLSVLLFALLAVSFICLMTAYIRSDFSLLNVVSNSHSAKPMLYKIAGTWGNHEGSLLLWVLILAGFGAAVAVFDGPGKRSKGMDRRLWSRTLVVQSLIGCSFLLFILLTSNPFTRVLPAPLDGQGLNPLLQDPGLAFHPPLLYVGYVGLSTAFSFAIAALILSLIHI